MKKSKKMEKETEKERES